MAKNEPLDNMQKELTQHFAKYLQGYCYSKAILEDYSKVVAKIEGIEPKEIEDRITERMKEIVKKTEEELRKK